MVRLGDDFSVVTPSAWTSWGRRGVARATRFWTLTWAWSRSVPRAKVTVSVRLPSAVDWESMYSMPSTPVISCSSGVATVLAMTSGLAPG